MCSKQVRLLVALAVAPWASAACSSSPVASDTSAGAPTYDGDHDRICSGTSEIRLALKIAGGGPAAPGSVMLSENGWSFLLVDGACTAWVLASDNDPLVRAKLAPAEEQQLAVSLRLADWGAITPPVGGGCPDAPSALYRFADARKSGPTCGVDATSAWGQLNAAVAAAIDDLAARATPSTGDLRYLVLRDESSNGLGNRTPVAWPLATPIETIALTTEQAFYYRPGESLLATGDDAAKLRAIRTTRANGTTAATFDYTPIVDDAGIRYQLYIRDALPQEQPNGLLPPDTF